jgi:cytochrome c peroxidase
MHDGRFDRLRQVLEHYEMIESKHGTRHVDVRSIPLTFNEQSDLIAFLLTLNDKSFVFNPAFSFPEKLKEALLKN